jgi:hypothetical protein
MDKFVKICLQKLILCLIKSIAIPDDPIKKMRGILKGGQSMAKALLRERKKDNDIDEEHSL